MTRAVQTVGYHDGWLCVCHAEPDWSKPELVTLYWPVRKVPRADAEYLIGKEAIGSGSGGRYSAREYPGGFWVTLDLPQGGATKAIHVTREPIPCPVRKGIEARYHQGRWEKHLKRGWVPA